MPKYHVVVGAYAMPDGRATVLSSSRPGHAATYVWAKPIGAFEWPMDTMTRHPGSRPMDYDQMEAILQGTGRYYWIARVYKSYIGLLDMYINLMGEDRVARYILDYDPRDVTVGKDYSGWPQPSDFYEARNAIRTEEFWIIA